MWLCVNRFPISSSPALIFLFVDTQLMAISLTSAIRPSLVYQSLGGSTTLPGSIKQSSSLRIKLRNRRACITSTISEADIAEVAVGEDLPLGYDAYYPKRDPTGRRRAGVLLHPTSFPGPYGIGDLGDQAFKFIDWLHRAGCTLWQAFHLLLLFLLTTTKMASSSIILDYWKCEFLFITADRFFHWFLLEGKAMKMDHPMLARFMSYIFTSEMTLWGSWILPFFPRFACLEFSACLWWLSAIV